MTRVPRDISVEEPDGGNLRVRIWRGPEWGNPLGLLNIETIRQGLKEEGYAVSISQLCRWFDIPRRSVYYKPTKKQPIVQERFARPIKQMIEEHPSFGYRTVAYLLKFNKNTVQRIFQLMHWQVRKRPIANGRGSARSGIDRALRHTGTRADAVPASLGQRAGLHQSQLHGAGAQLWTSPGVHYATQS